MSEPQQPPAQPYGSPPPHQADPQSPGAPQYPSAPQYSGAPQYPVTQQHPGAPQYPGTQQHPGAPQYPSAPQSPGASSAAPTVGPGRLAFILALVSLGLSLVVSVSYPLIYRWAYDAVAIGAFGTIGNGLIFLVALAALLLGIVGARRPGSKLLPGIAIGITAAQLAGILVSWVSNLFYALPF